MWSALMGAGKEGVTPKASSSGGTSTGSGDLGPAAAAAAEEGGEEGSVSSGHSVFDYVHYGLARAAEYRRLKEQLLVDCPEWFR